MLFAGAGSAVDEDGARAAVAACRQALAAPRQQRVDQVVLFAGVRHGEDEYEAVLRAVEQETGAVEVVGCSATGVLTDHDEVENAAAVAVLAISADGRIPAPVLVQGIRDEARDAGRRLAREAQRRIGDRSAGSALAVLVDPEELDAADFLTGFSETAPGLAITGAGASGGARGARVFAHGRAFGDAAVALVLPADLSPTFGMTQGCQGLSDPMIITAADGNLVREIEGRPALEMLERTLDEPRNRGLGRMGAHVLAGIGEADGTDSEYVVRPIAAVEDVEGALAVAEPVHTGQTIRFTLRDAIGAREDMKRMLDEQAQARGDHTPAFGLYFNCAGRGSALYGSAGLDPELIRRRFGGLPVVGLESSFEIAPTSGRARLHMFSGVLLLAG
jgi:small ligand-binding sensory domain FIST